MKQEASSQRREAGSDDASLGAAEPSSPRSPAPLALHHRPYFETKPLKARLSAALRALREGSMVVMVEGEKGVGKTAFLRRLAATMTAGLEVRQLQARHATGERQVLALIGQAFEAGEPADVAALAERLGARRLVAAIDEAHHLSPFAIHALVDLQRAVARAGGRFGMLLAGEPRRLRALPGLPSFAAYGPGWMVSFRLPRFSAQETREYIRQGLEAAGGTRTLDDAALRAVHRRSRGVPGRINRAIEELLSGRPAETRRPVFDPSRLWPWPAVIGLGVVAVTLLGYSLISGTGGRQPEPASVVPAATAVQEPPPPLAPASVLPDVAPPEATSPVAASPEPSASALATAASPPPAQAAAPEARPEQPSDAGSPDAAWLLSQPPGHYTLQLGSAPDRAEALAFVERNPLADRTVAVETVRGAGTRYLILYGSYASLAEAKRALAALPAGLRGNEPFPRRIQSVQAITVR